MLMIEKAIRVVDSVGDVRAQRRRHALDPAHEHRPAFLLAQWQRGALAGQTPQEAFCVRCDEEQQPAEPHAPTGSCSPRSASRRSRHLNSWCCASAASTTSSRSPRPARLPAYSHERARSSATIRRSTTTSWSRLWTRPARLRRARASGSPASTGDAGFSECAGLEMSMQPEEYKEGGRNGAVLKFPNRVTWTNLTLKRGAASTSALWDWHFGFVDGIGTASRRRHRDARCRASACDGLVLPARSAREIHRARRSTPRRTAVAIEAIEIAHEGIHQVPGFAWRRRRRARPEGWGSRWTSRSAKCRAPCARSTARRSLSPGVLQQIVEAVTRRAAMTATIATSVRMPSDAITGGVSAERDEAQ